MALVELLCHRARGKGSWDGNSPRQKHQIPTVLIEYLVHFFE